MSLDVYLVPPPPPPLPTCPHCGQPVGEREESDDQDEFGLNITHNLRRMANEAEIGDLLWTPEEAGITHAKQLVEPLERALADLRAHPSHYRQFDAKNGWGTYEHFVPWVQRLLEGCAARPEYTVKVSR